MARMSLLTTNFGPGSTAVDFGGFAGIFRSTDGGKTRGAKRLRCVTSSGQNLFFHRGRLYLMGTTIRIWPRGGFALSGRRYLERRVVSDRRAELSHRAGTDCSARRAPTGGRWNTIRRVHGVYFEALLLSAPVKSDLLESEKLAVNRAAPLPGRAPHLASIGWRATLSLRPTASCSISCVSTT